MIEQTNKPQTLMPGHWPIALYVRFALKDAAARVRKAVFVLTAPKRNDALLVPVAVQQIDDVWSLRADSFLFDKQGKYTVCARLLVDNTSGGDGREKVTQLLSIHVNGDLPAVNWATISP